MKKMLHYIKKYSYLFGILLFLLILLRTDFLSLLEIIKSIKISYIILASVLSFLMLLSQTWGWNYLKKKQNISYAVKDSFLMYGAGVYIGLLTPGRLGEITKALYLKKDGHSMGKSLVSVIVDRIFDFGFLFCFAFFGSIFFLNLFQKQILILIISLGAFIALFIFLLKIGLIKFALKKFFYIFIPQKYQKSWKINFQDFIDGIRVYKLSHYVISFFITSLSWIIYYIQIYILAKGIGIATVPFLYLAISVTVAGFITLIPVSISGIGTRDATLILLLAPFAILKEQAIILSTSILLITVFIALIGLICWLIKPIRT